MVEVRVPSTLRPGEPLLVTHHGKEYEVTIPQGVRAGQSFQVELPGAPPETAPERAGSSKLPGSPGRGRARWGDDASSAGATTGSSSPGRAARDALAGGASSAAERRKEYEAQRRKATALTVTTSAPIVTPTVTRAEPGSPARRSPARAREAAADEPALECAATAAPDAAGSTSCWRRASSRSADSWSREHSPAATCDQAREGWRAEGAARSAEAATTSSAEASAAPEGAWREMMCMTSFWSTSMTRASSAGSSAAYALRRATRR
jgi:hypothetical protein